MAVNARFVVEPWSLHEVGLDVDALAETESLFTLSNGHIGWRGNLDEGDPHGLSGSYLNGVHELRPLPYAEGGYGYPERDQVVLNVTNGKLIRLLVDDEPFDVRYGDLLRHERVLDFRAGLLHRDVEWASPSDKKVRIRSTRLVSLVERAVAAIHYEVTALDERVRLVIQSELVVNEEPPPISGDPRKSKALASPWTSVVHHASDTTAELVHRTQFSDISVACAMSHDVTGPASTSVTTETFDDLARSTISVTLQPGESITLIKYVTYGWSGARTPEAMRDQVDGAIVMARDTGWDGLVEAQRSYLDDFWDRADVELDGDDEIQQAVRFALFHVLQASARSERRAIPAKGLTGTGYDGHAFWDSETFVFSVLDYMAPESVSHALRWRHDTLDLAKDRAEQLGLKGAAFPWRTISGAECSSYWPAGTAAFHVSADVADAVVRYLHSTQDQRFEREAGLELLVETARLWLSLGHYDVVGNFRIDGVTGPDEYSAVADNNVYTNLMAQRNFRAAADLCERLVNESAALGVDHLEINAWRGAADAVVIPYSEKLGVHEQAERFTSHELWDFVATPTDAYPLLLYYPYFDIYRKQVVKQADLVLAMYLRGDAFTAEQKRANFDYYDALTVRDSSLSACIQSVVAADVGYLTLAYDYLAEAAFMDLHDLEHNTSDGLHVASLAGTWIALAAGFGGLRPEGETLRFAPRLPGDVTRLVINVTFRGRRLRVTTTPVEVSYLLRDGEDLEVFHFEDSLSLKAGTPVSVQVPHSSAAREIVPPPTQPHGRAPRHRQGGRFVDEVSP